MFILAEAYKHNIDANFYINWVDRLWFTICNLDDTESGCRQCELCFREFLILTSNNGLARGRHTLGQDTASRRYPQLDYSLIFDMSFLLIIQS